jgi:carboxyl-terminal processing protease
MMGNKKLQVWLPLIFSLVMIVGMFLGYKLGNQNGGNKGFFSSNTRSSLQEAVDLIRMRYVDSVHLDSLEGRAIQEMMKELDPHSVYLPPVDLKAANEDLAGNFEGIGVEFNILGDTVNVVYVVTNSPSEKAGIQIGDKIIKANNVMLAGKGFASDSIKKYIRGERGSKAVLQVLRDKKTMEIAVTRGTIPVPSIDAAYMIDKATGYIRLNKFTDNSYEEFMQAMEGLQKKGLQNLIYDLRGNGGGFMNEAVEMADEFLDGDKLIVYTEGVNSKKREYRCRRPGLFEKGKLVIVVDHLSASASEVLAGALQDWCRATVIGRRTFGKGLVQEQYSLTDGAAIRLTIARYYTPLGRSIQRSYEKGGKVYMDDLWERWNSGEMLSLDSLKSHNHGKIYTSNCNDTLYGSDGITPNVFVPLDTSIIQQEITKVLRESNVLSIPYVYYLEHRQEMAQYSSATDFAQRFDATKLWDGYVKYPGGSMAFEIITGELKTRIQQRLKAQLARFRWRNDGLYQVLNTQDPVIRRAMELVSK